MEHHREMAFDAIDKIEEVLLSEARRDDPVEAFPDDKSAGGCEKPEENLGTGRGPLEEVPAVVGAVGDDVEVPSEAGEVRGFSAGHG
jgi:hypothetical protein